MASDDSYYILRHQADAVQEATSTNQGIDEDGIEAAFDVRSYVLSVILVICVLSVILVMYVCSVCDIGDVCDVRYTCTCTCDV